MQSPIVSRKQMQPVLLFFSSVTGRALTLHDGQPIFPSIVMAFLAGDNGTIDGQGAVWWSAFYNKTLDYTRGHLVELIDSKDILISNLTFRDSPFWTIHPVYCRYAGIENS